MEQRELKFRMWIGKNHRMYYGIIEVMNCMMRQMAFDQKVLPEGHDSKFPKDYVSDLDTRFMEFTGLKDKNGKEIYEGDRLRYTFLEVISGGIREPEPKFITVESILRFDVMRAISDTDEVEIIGNVYEHPHLLAVGN